MNTKFNLSEIIRRTVEGIIKVVQFSSFIPRVKSIFPFIENDDRKGNCFPLALNISLNLLG